MDKIFEILKTLYNEFLSFYNGLNDFGIYMFYGAISCVVLIIVILLFVKKSNKEDYKIVIEEFEEEQNESIEELEEIEDLEENTDKLDDILKMRDRLSVELERKDPVEDFENDQEKTAVISYEELKKAAMKIEDEDIPPVIPYPSVKEEKVREDNLAFTAKYRRSDFISPIHGIQGNYDPKHEPKETKFEKTINVEPLNKEIKNSVEFLESLKDLRKNLN